MKKIICFYLVIAMVLSLVMPAFANEDYEVIYQTSFEDGISDWTYYGKHSPMYVKFTGSCATDKDKSVYIVDIKDSTSIGIISPYFDVKAGETYSASVDLYKMSGSVKFHFKFYDADKKQIFNKSTTSKADSWQNIFATYVAPEGAAYVNIYLCTDSANFGEGYFDNFYFVKGKKTATKIEKETYPDGKESLTLEPVDDGVKDGTLLFSDSFENGFSEWVYYNTTSSEFIKEAENEAFEGKKSIYITDSDEKTTTGLKSPYIPASEGNKYTAGFFIKTVSGNSTRLYIRFFDKDKKQLENKSFYVVSSDWHPLYGTLQAPERTAYVQVLIVGTTSGIGECYVDNVTLHKGLYSPEIPEKKYAAPKQEKAVDAKIAAPVNNKLSYMEYNEMGDKIGDFSYAGFYGGDYLLPETKNLPVVATLSPSGTGDDTKMLQKAINSAERKDGGINVVKLKAGKYYVDADGITVRSGVLLSGEGQGPDGTIIYAYAPLQYSVIKISGTTLKDVGEKAYILNDYVKSGSKEIDISYEDAKNFKVGDRVKVYHSSTNEWAKAIKMVGTINVYDNDTTWHEGKVNMVTERTINKIDGTKITFDFPFFVPYMKDLVPAYITKIDESTRVINSGVENLRVESYYNGDKTDESHATAAIQISNAKNVFVRDVTSKYFYFGLVKCNSGAKNVTILNCSLLEPVSTITGERRYSFVASTGSQQMLVSGCYSYDARHDYATSGQATGPVVFVDSVADSSNTSSETHGTWSTGVLYDNIYQIGNESKGFITLANRGIYGTVLSQGWTSAGCVSWNNLSSTIIVHKPPVTYENFAVGIWGHYTDDFAKDFKERNITSFKRIYRTGESIEHTEENFATDDNTSIAGDSYKESVYAPVNPRSLYKAQLSERYTGVISNARPNSPVIIYPKPDKLTMENRVKISGLSQLGAEKVTIYVDNSPYDAKINSDNTYELFLDLEDGTHKIYATQTIDGFEGNKTADRFITVKESKGNPIYLQSIYSPEITTMLLNDKRQTFDAILNGIKVNVFGSLLYSDVSPTEINGRVLVPMRAIFEKFGAEILWDEKTSTATAVSNGITIKITENSKDAYVNEKPVILDVPATIIDGRFVVPVRFISEAFGCEVSWIDETKTVIIEQTH